MPVGGKGMKLPRLMKQQLALLQNMLRSVGGADQTFLLRKNQLPEVVCLSLGLEIFIELKIVNRHDFRDVDQVFQLVLKIGFHENIIL